VREIGAAIVGLGQDDTVTGVVVTSVDGAIAGADIGELAALRTPEQCAAMCRDGYAVHESMAMLEKPIVAALDGPVLGGGAELAMACHARVVGRKLVMGQPEVNLGIIPGNGATQRLPRLIGVVPALELLRTGRTMNATEACAAGWAEGEPAKDVVAAARELIRAHRAGRLRIGAVDPAPVAVPEPLPVVDLGHHSLATDAILVDVIRRGLQKPLADGLSVEAEGFGRCRSTVDMDIGMKTFMQNGPRVPAAFLNE
jgi:enoyl-CoA hydratase/carnithine racemase